MKIIKKILDIHFFKQVVAESITENEVGRKMCIGTGRVRKLLVQYQIDCSHFRARGRQLSAKRIRVNCKHCGAEFETLARKPKQCCNRSCANSYFRSGPNHGSWKDNKRRKATYYKRKCFERCGKKCIMCDETFAIDVHHIDRNYMNNDVNNLVPLCANHHRYAHSRRYRHLVEDAIKQFQLGCESESSLL